MINHLLGLQCLLAALFLLDGLGRISRPQAFRLQSPGDLGFFFFLILSDLLFSISLFLPLMFPLWLIFRVGAALLAALVMAFAAFTQVMKNQSRTVWTPLLLSVMSALLVWENIVVIR
jgi:hypothetical protein